MIGWAKTWMGKDLPEISRLYALHECIELNAVAS